MFHITFDELKKVLLSSGFLDEKQLTAAGLEAKKTDRDVANVLIEHGDISEEYLAEILAEYFGVGYVSLKKIKIPEEDVKLIPEQVAKSKKIIVFGREGDPSKAEASSLKLAMEDPEILGQSILLKNTLSNQSFLSFQPVRISAKPLEFIKNLLLKILRKLLKRMSPRVKLKGWMLPKWLKICR